MSVIADAHLADVSDRAGGEAGTARLGVGADVEETGLADVTHITSSKLLGRTLTVTASRNLDPGQRRVDFVVCPAGYEAVGGGAWGDPASLIDTIISVPRIGSGPPADGSNGPPATGWTTEVLNPSTAFVTVHWTVVCAKEGA